MATITTLIPAYKKDHLGEVFLGLARQTFRDFRVLLSDDSADDGITALLRTGAFDSLTRGLDVRVMRGPKNARMNHQTLLDAWAASTPFVHFHLDDDIIYPDFYQAHLDAHATGRFSATVSRRWLSQDDGQPARSVPLPTFVAASPLQVVPVAAPELFQSTVPRCYNWLGEFSNMLLSAEGLTHWPRPSATELNYFGWMDIGFLLSASQHLPVACLRDHLGVFRQHAEQSSQRVPGPVSRVAFIAWAAYALQAWREHRIDHAQAASAVILTVGDCLRRFGEGDPMMERFYTIVEQHGRSLDAMYAEFLPFWHQLLNTHPATAPVPTGGPGGELAPSALPVPQRQSAFPA